MNTRNMKTDAQLLADVQAELKWDPSIKADDVSVQVKDGVVTLSGHVDAYWRKAAAERAASRVKGVKALAEEIEVRQENGELTLHARADTQRARAMWGLSRVTPSRLRAWTPGLFVASLLPLILVLMTQELISREFERRVGPHPVHLLDRVVDPEQRRDFHDPADGHHTEGEHTQQGHVALDLLVPAPGFFGFSRHFPVPLIRQALRPAGGRHRGCTRPGASAVPDGGCRRSSATR